MALRARSISQPVQGGGGREWASVNQQNSAELKGPGKLSRIRPEIFDFEPDLGRKPGQNKPKMSGTVPTNRHTTIPNDSGPISACFDDDPIAQPRPTKVNNVRSDWRGSDQTRNSYKFICFSTVTQCKTNITCKLQEP